MKIVKTLLLVAVAVVVIGLVPTHAFAAGTCPQANTTNCTSTLQVTATVQTAVYLSIVTDATNSGCTLGGTDTAATVGLGNINGLGVGTAPTCSGGTITVSTNPAGPVTPGTAISSATYRTNYILFAQVSGFTNGTATVQGQVTADTGTATTGVTLLEDANATADASLASVTTTQAALANFPTSSDSGTGISSSRKIAIKVDHKNGAGTAGSVNKTITYTITAS